VVKPGCEAAQHRVLRAERELSASVTCQIAQRCPQRSFSGGSDAARPSAAHRNWTQQKSQTSLLLAVLSAGTGKPALWVATS